ncbi:hypothetical protein [Bacillus pretiosus]|uniref:Uncharacterized protein n=1 Tax=Bacillus pretiosus TaxID=2983392 RepID=A0ABT3EQZ0_9BACI|nr:hypothetical protein [Bacillus pretiosus]MCW1239207.1 hypothetical protein [Bacillus pretiosus]
MAKYEVSEKLWGLMEESDKEEVYELLKATGSIKEGDTIEPSSGPEERFNPGRDIKKKVCKIACDAAFSAAVAAAASLNPIAAAAAIAVANAAKDECKDRC